MRGKWAKAGVPHRGWTCVEVEDLDEALSVCEMCESQEIRYAHHMVHAEYPSGLVVGCVCAEHMEEDRIGPRKREQAMRSRAGKRRRWLTRRWRRAPSGREWLRADGYRVVVYGTGSSWRATVAAEDGSFLRHSRLTYPTAAAAKLRAFDVITHRLSKQQP